MTTAAVDYSMTKRDVAAMFGVSVRTVEGWVRRGDIPFVKTGSRRNCHNRFSRAELEQWSEANRPYRGQPTR